MKITDVEGILLRLPEVREIGDGCQSVLIILVHTDAGVTGIGEAHSNPEVSRAVLDSPLCSVSASGLKRLLIGEDPLAINRLWDKMYKHSQTYGRRGAALHVISGIDIALWDILGKVAGQPIHRLLGGARKSVRKVYASDLAPAEPTPAAMLAQAERHVAAGYGAVKFGWGGLGGDPRADVRAIGQMRKALGDEVDIMVDLGFAVPLEDAIYLGQGLPSTAYSSSRSRSRPTTSRASRGSPRSRRRRSRPARRRPRNTPSST
jgi:L-alanine-DL-glutamate epimerase-like enolase superfamily enzyme